MEAYYFIGERILILIFNMRTMMIISCLHMTFFHISDGSPYDVILNAMEEHDEPKNSLCSFERLNDPANS